MLRLNRMRYSRLLSCIEAPLHIIRHSPGAAFLQQRVAPLPGEALTSGATSHFVLGWNIPYPQGGAGGN